MVDLDEVRREEIMNDVNSSVSDAIDVLIQDITGIYQEAPVTPEDKVAFEALVEQINKAKDRFMGEEVENSEDEESESDIEEPRYKE
jgi:hypothetical protein